MLRGMCYEDAHTPTSSQCEWQDGDAAKKQAWSSLPLSLTSRARADYFDTRKHRIALVVVEKERGGVT